MAPSETVAKNFSLPVGLVTTHDVSILIKELDEIDNFFMQTKLRRSGSAMDLPKTTPQMEELVNSNKLNLLKEEDRVKIKFILQTIRSQAPIFHFSFAAEPNRQFLEKITAWLRQEVHALAIVRVGLEPTIGAGFVLRTTNKFFDFSLKELLKHEGYILTSEIKKVA